MKLERYESYKDSGIDWLGEIPNEWRVKRVKDLGSLQNGISQDANYFGEGFPFVSYGHVYNDTIDADKIKTLAKSSKEDQKLYSVKEGDVFFTRTSETVDEIGFSGTCQKTIEKAIFSGFTIRLRPSKKKIWRGFSKYYFKASSNRNFFVRNMNIVTRASLGQGLLNQLPILLPPQNTQVKIASFLDEHSLRINQELTILEQKREKYKELKQAIISDTVLRGLDKNVELKNSEIEWIGDIPKHWKVKRLKDFIKFTIGGEVIDVSYWNEGTELTYTAGKNPVYSTFSNFPARKRTQANDVLIARNGDGFIHIPKLNSIFTNVVQLVRLSKKIDVRFIFYSLENVKFHINKTSNGDFIASLNKDMWFNSFLIIPDLEEQIKISNYLDQKTSKIDSIVETIGKKIEVLKEFRKTLINDVVTGKVKVA